MSIRFIVQQIVSVIINMKTALILCFSWQSMGVLYCKGFNINILSYITGKSYTDHVI